MITHPNIRFTEKVRLYPQNGRITQPHNKVINRKIGLHILATSEKQETEHGNLNIILEKED